MKSNEFPTVIRGLIFSLSPFESNHFKELFSAASNLRVQTVGPYSELIGNFDILKLIAKKFDDKYQKVIKMTTNLTQFTMLHGEDQVILLKSAIHELEDLISFVNFNFEGQFWTILIVRINQRDVPKQGSPRGIFRNPKR